MWDYHIRHLAFRPGAVVNRRGLLPGGPEDKEERRMTTTRFTEEEDLGVTNAERSE